MTIPGNARQRKSAPANLNGTYANDAPIYIERGWPSVLPLPAGQKKPPPVGFTCGGAKIPTVEQVEVWRCERSNGNPALYLADGLLCVDIDNYAKGDRPAGRALEVITQVEERAGCKFPPTYVLRNRTDGSEKRFYRVPKGLLWRSNLGAGVDLVHHHHRYVNAGVNPDTGNREQWFGLDGNPMSVPPRPGALPELPAELVDELRREGTALPKLADQKEAQLLLDSLPDGAMSKCVRERLDRALRDLSGLNGSRHDATLGNVRTLILYGAAELTGASTALKVLGHDFVETVWTDLNRGSREVAQDEFDRMVTDGARRVAALTDGERASWRTALKSFEPGGFWHAQTNGTPASGDELVTRSLADLTPAKVTWLWRGWVPRGKVTILEGEPEEGKSVLTLDWTAIVTGGREWPVTIVDGESLPRDRSEPAGVVLVGVEDDLEDTVVPRLDAAGADRSLIHVVNQPKDDKGNPVPFLIPDDIERLRQAIVETGARLVVIDPITAFLSTRQAKSGDDPSTRQALMPLVILAGDTECAIVLVRHLNKTHGMSAKHRGSGTIAYTGIARSVIVAGELKEPKQNGPTHAIALTKGNLTKRPKAIGYRLDSAPSDPDNPIVTWLGALELSADQLVGADGAKVSDARKSAPVRDECERALGELLADGPMPMKEAIKKTREAVGCGAGAVHDAAKRLRVVKKPVRDGKKIDHWTWELPPTKIRLRLADGDGDGGDGGEDDLEDPDP